MQEKRAHYRRTIRVALACHRGNGEAFGGHSKDLSFGGMFIESDELPAFGEQLVVAMAFPGSPDEFRFPAVVRWAAPGGFGVQFGLLGARETHAIAKLVSGN